MSSRFAASKVLDREFLAIRSTLIGLAAALDRIGRAEEYATDDPRIQQIRRGVEALAGDAPNRAECIELLFSLPYEPNWREASPPSAPQS